MGILLPKIMSVVIFFMDQNHKNKSLSKILNIKKLMNVDKSIETANGLPNECYTSEQYLEYERDKIFCDKWTVIGVGSSIPNAGDAKPYNLLGIPLMIIRDKDLKIRVFHNVCSHRGFKLLDKPCTLKNVIRCPYHSWSYDFSSSSSFCSFFSSTGRSKDGRELLTMVCSFLKSFSLILILLSQL
mgnify:CR=1 FL=1